MKAFGLIGKKLSHSFSQKYFTEKFKSLQLSDHTYQLFELASIRDVAQLKNLKGLVGFNITVPYKQEIMPYLTSLDDSAKMVGAVNVVKIQNGNWVGYNSDYYGFLHSLQNWIDSQTVSAALILGTGGASKAVEAALKTLNISFQTVSRNPAKGQIAYEEGNERLREVDLIVNTTPLGMSPKVEGLPPINYAALMGKHYLYDLVYNPVETLFLKKGNDQGAHTKNGLEMLHLQAEKSWEIWNN